MLSSCLPLQSPNVGAPWYLASLCNPVRFACTPGTWHRLVGDIRQTFLTEFIYDTKGMEPAPVNQHIQHIVEQTHYCFRKQNTGRKTSQMKGLKAVLDQAQDKLILPGTAKISF